MEQLQHRLATDLREQISQGVYGAGERLPGVRALARTRRVSIAIVLAAYRRLEDDALIEARPRSGYYVRPRPNLAVQPPAASTPAAQPSPVTGQELVLSLVKATNVEGLVQLGAAVPDASFLPTRAVERALARAARLHRSRAAAYEFPPGLPELRRQIARRMVQAGLRHRCRGGGRHHQWLPGGAGAGVAGRHPARRRGGHRIAHLLRPAAGARSPASGGARNPHRPGRGPVAGGAATGAQALAGQGRRRDAELQQPAWLLHAAGA